MIRLHNRPLKMMIPFVLVLLATHVITGIGNDCSPKSMYSKLHRKQNKTDARNESRGKNVQNKGKGSVRLLQIFLHITLTYIGRTGITEDMFRELYNSISVCLVGLHEKRKKKKIVR